MIVEPAEHDLLHALAAEGEEHRRERGGEGRVEQHRQGREQGPQPLDLLAAGVPGQQGVDHRELDRLPADQVDHLAPSAGRHEPEPTSGRATQPEYLNLGYRR